MSSIATPVRSSKVVPDRTAFHKRLTPFSREDEWSVRERRTYGNLRAAMALPNGDPPSSMLWGEDETGMPG